MPLEHELFDLGRVELQSGGVLPAARLAYKTYGRLNEARDNAVLLPTFYTGTHLRNEGYFGAGRAIDPARHFVVSVNTLGNGWSSSPSNTPPPAGGRYFPHVTLHDNVRLQFILLTEVLKVRRLALVAGWSMGGTRPINGVRNIRIWSMPFSRFARPPRPRPITSFSWRG